MTRAMRSAALALVLAASIRPAAAEGSPMHSGALAHALDRVAHTGRVLYVAAHPDDENTRLLGYLANARHLTVAYLSLTRGGGGQNLIGKEQRELLDVIRTQELLAARRLDGARQRFTRAEDFGYSKTADETLAKWGRDEVLADVVWTIRTFQPDVVITRFSEEPPNHGHHTASAILAREAVAAAADPGRFPEQLQRGAAVWAVERLVHNFPTFRGKPPEDALRLDVGGYDPRLGMGYGELAALSRSQHKSQGFGSAGQRGELLEHFVHVAGSRAEKDLLEGIDVRWSRFGERARPLAEALEEARRAFSPDAPERAQAALLRALRALEAIPDGPRRRDARAAIEELLASTAGLFVRATADRAAVSPGTSVPVRVEVVMGRPAGLTLRRAVLPGGAAIEVGAALAAGAKRELTGEGRIAADAEISVPYWLREPSAGARAEVRDLRLVGEPLGPPPLSAAIELSAGDQPFTLTVPIEHVWVDPVHGERARWVAIAPPATVSPTREAVMLPNGAGGRVALRVRGWRDGLTASVRLPVPAGWTVRPASRPVSLARAGDETMVEFEVKAKGAAPATLVPEVEVDGKAWSFREDAIDHPHIPVQAVLQRSEVRLVPVMVTLPKGLVGYVEGSGDTVMDDLAHVGVRLQRIDDQALRSADLSRYSAIVLGIRAFNTRDVLRAVHPRLMAYVAKGGTLVVQYNTNSFVGRLGGEIGPHPLTIGRGRVTDERAEVTALVPGHPVLSRPNRIAPADFEGWIQERGLYFGEKWDPKYTPLLRMADPGERPEEGSLLVAKHGRGRFVYTGLSFFRQLPAGVPGAYRLFANLLGSD